MGRYGSPGPVQDTEKVYRILIAPVDIGMTAEQIAVTAVTHSETIGMSVLRDRASDLEFRKVIQDRTARDGRVFVAVAELDCGAIRLLKSANDQPGRRVGDRHFIVVDTDMEDLPYHADIFNMMPRQDADGKPSNKTVWRREREKLLQLANSNIVKREAFREGRV